MKIKWVRGNDKINFNHPYVFFVLGIKGAGKSSLLEHLAESYLEHGHGVFDEFGSKDGENLAWLRSPWAKDKRILLIKGDNVDVDGCFPAKTVDAIGLNDFENFDIIISSAPLYINTDQEFSAVAKLTDLLYGRLHYKKLYFLVCREAANLYYSRLKIRDSQTMAKAEMTYLIRESRHMGLSLGLDSLRYHAIDIDIRSISDFTFLKNVGAAGLPKDLKWLYGYVDPFAMRALAPQQFIILSSGGSIGIGTFPEIVWHKKEGEDILRKVGLKVEYGEMPMESQDKGTFKTVSDKEHAEIIRIYIEEKIGREKLAERTSRSPKTINRQIWDHNTSISRSGFCPRCRRTRSPYETTPATWTKTSNSIYTLPQTTTIPEK